MDKIFPSVKKDYNYSPDVFEREYVDNGFSKGWGFHFPTNEEFWIDCHNHLDNWRTHSDIYKLLDQWFSRLDAYRLGKVLVIAREPASLKVLKDISSQDDRFDWLIWIDCDKPDISTLEKALEHGAVGLKLHNKVIMQGLVRPDIWLSDEWCKVFELVEKSGIPILWHVTQRVTKSPYHGGGYNPYWSEGQKRGVTYTNEDLLQITIKISEMFPKIKIIGAHQHYVSLKRLSEIFDKHENMYIDTSVGCYLRWADDLHEEDRKIYYDFFVKYQDRILFGTDSALKCGGVDEYLVQSFLCHARFINKLRLPHEVLQKVAHVNAEKLFGVEPVDYARRGNVRP